MAMWKWPSKGPEVEKIQKLLNKCKIKCKVDADFGKKTYEAVKKFQQQCTDPKLTADGVVGKKTMQALETLAKTGGKPADAKGATGDAKDLVWPTELDLDYTGTIKGYHKTRGENETLILKMMDDLGNVGTKEASDLRKSLMRENADLARAYNRTLEGASWLRSLQKVFEKCRAKDPAKAKRFLDAAVKKAKPKFEIGSRSWDRHIHSLEQSHKAYEKLMRAAKAAA